MSAEISVVDGRAEMMYVGKKPWHGLGTELPKLATSVEAMKAAHLDWVVEKRPVFFEGKGAEKGKFIKGLPGRQYVVVRTDTEKGLGMAGRDWTPLQNSEAFSFTDAIVQEKEAIYETAGALMGGRRVWLLAKLRGIMRIKGSEDQLERYLLLANTHENGSSLRVQLTTTRVVCQNTLNMALGEKGSAYFRIRHSRKLGEKVAAAREALGLINVRFEELKAKIEKLASTSITRSSFEVFAESIGFKPDAKKKGDKDRYDALLSAFETSPGAKLATANGTLWGAVNAVTYYVDHARSYRQVGGSAGDNKLRSIWWGAGNSLKSKAFETALAMTR